MWFLAFYPIIISALVFTECITLAFHSSSNLKVDMWKHRSYLSVVHRNKFRGSENKLFSKNSNIIKASRASNSAGTTGGASTSMHTGKFSMKQWPQPVVVSKGNYEQDAFLDDFIDGPLYSQQKNLPKLPIPSIESTLRMFLPSALPLAETEEEAQNLIQACEDFPNEDITIKLQERLEARRDEASNNNSWLQLWWNQEGYLKYREPVVINVSYFFNIKHDDETLKEADADVVKGEGGEKSLGVMRAASALIALAQYRKQVCSGQMPQETIGKKNIPLCSTAFKYMFHSCRIPRKDQDVYKMYDPFLYKHCIVAVKGQFFAMDFVDAENEDEPLSLESLEAGLMQCISLAKVQNEKYGLDLGVLTTDHRDEWAKNRERLLQIGGETMEKALHKLESGAVVLCLDDDDPITFRELANRYWHGYRESYMNRWYDKSINLMCQSNGKLGFLGKYKYTPLHQFGSFLSTSNFSRIACI